MAGVIETTQTFTATDVVTSTKLNDLIDTTVFTSDAITGTTLTVSGAGKLSVSTGGVTSNEIAANAVVTLGILNSAVTAAKLATDAVETLKIKDANVTAAKLASDAVTTAKILNANVTAAKLSGAQTGSAPIYGARAWCHFDATRNAAGSASSANTARYLYPNGSGNVTSVTKTATGTFTVALATALPSANYAVIGIGHTGGFLRVSGSDEATQTTTSFTLIVRTLDDNLEDSDSNTFCIFG